MRTCLIATLAAGLLGGQSALASGDICGEIALTMSTADRQLTYVDIGTEGVSPGDMRIGKASVLDGDGNAVGETFWQILLLQPEDNGEAYSSSGRQYFHFPDGQVYFEVLINDYGTDASDAAKIHPRTEPNPPGLKMVAIGGTGAYEDVAGFMTLQRRDDGITYEFNLACQR